MADRQYSLIIEGMKNLGNMGIGGGAPQQAPTPPGGAAPGGGGFASLDTLSPNECRSLK